MLCRWAGRGSVDLPMSDYRALMGSSEHTLDYLAATAELAQRVEPKQVDAMATRPGRGARARRAAVHPRRRRRRRPRLARGQRLSQALRASRATRRPTTSPSSPRAPTTTAGRRRSALARGLAPVASATRCSSSRSAAARASTTSRRTSWARWRPRASVGASIYGVVGAPGGTLAELADVAILIEPPPELRTPLVESFQAVVWHALVSHPELAVKQGHWESLAARVEA